MSNIALTLYMAIGLLVIIAFGSVVWIYTHFKKLFTTLEISIEKVVHFSHADPLTGLENRTQFFENFKTKIIHPREKHQKLALFFLDIDNFHGINDVAHKLLEATASGYRDIPSKKMT